MWPRELHFGQQLIGVLEAVHLALFLVEGADDAHAGQVFAGEAKDPVEAGLHRLIKRTGDDHDAEDHDAQQRDRHHEDEGGAEVDRKGMIMAPITTKGLRRNRRRKRFNPLCT